MKFGDGDGARRSAYRLMIITCFTRHVGVTKRDRCQDVVLILREISCATQELSLPLTEAYFHLDSVQITTPNPISPSLGSFLLSDNLNQTHRCYLSYHLHSSHQGFRSDFHPTLKTSVSVINARKSKQLILRWIRPASSDCFPPQTAHLVRHEKPPYHTSPSGILSIRTTLSFISAPLTYPHHHCPRYLRSSVLHSH